MAERALFGRLPSILGDLCLILSSNIRIIKKIVILVVHVYIIQKEWYRLMSTRTIEWDKQIKGLKHTSVLKFDQLGPTEYGQPFDIFKHCSSTAQHNLMKYYVRIWMNNCGLFCKTTVEKYKRQFPMCRDNVIYIETPSYFHQIDRKLRLFDDVKLLQYFRQNVNTQLEQNDHINIVHT